MNFSRELNWKKIVYVFTGALIISYFLLANLLRGFLPRTVEDFSPLFLVLISLFFLSLSLYALKRIFFPVGIRFFSFLRESKAFHHLRDLLLLSPREVYGVLNYALPPFPWVRDFLWRIIEKYGPRKLRTSFHLFIYFIFFFLPSIFPPLFLLGEYFLSPSIHLFYYSLLLLWLPLIYRFLVFSLRDYGQRERKYLETFFSVRKEGIIIHLEFYPGQVEDREKVEKWYLFLRFGSQIYALEHFQSKYSSHLLLGRSFLYFLAWTQILLSHPHFQNLLSSFLPS